MKLKFRGAELIMSRARKPKVKSNTEKYLEGATKIFVGAIPSKVTLEEFQKYFEQYGPIDDICLPMKSKSKSVNRGHGFVNYVYPLSAKLAIDNHKNHYLRAKWVEVRVAKPRNDTSPNYKAFSTTTTNISESATVSAKTIDSSEKKNNNNSPDFLWSINLKECKNNARESQSYFSLGNTFYGSMGHINYTDRLSNLIPRLLQDQSLSLKQNTELLSTKKRLSIGMARELLPNITNSFRINRYEESIKERM